MLFDANSNDIGVPEHVHCEVLNYIGLKVELSLQLMISEISVAGNGELYCYTLLHKSTVAAAVENDLEYIIPKTGNYSGVDRDLCINASTFKITDLKYQ